MSAIAARVPVIRVAKKRFYRTRRTTNRVTTNARVIYYMVRTYRKRARHIYYMARTSASGRSEGVLTSQWHSSGIYYDIWLS